MIGILFLVFSCIDAIVMIVVVLPIVLAYICYKISDIEIYTYQTRKYAYEREKRRLDKMKNNYIETGKVEEII
jgi:di/tricarboxylate transporter